MSTLDNKTAIVTGAGRGVGLATAIRLGEAGAKVIVNDLDADEGEACVQAIRQAGGTALGCPGDVTQPDYPEQLVDAALAAFSGIDIVINNAGYIWNGAMHNHSDCLLYTSPSPRDQRGARMPSSA